MKKYSGNDDVVFGDINLADARIRSIHGTPQNPGAGGWPTVRYYNKKPGYGGDKYKKKTSRSMCEELGDIKYISAYVEEAGETSLCSVATKKGCDERSLKYIVKMEGKSQDDRAKQLTRLTNMLEEKMSKETYKWAEARVAILRQFDKGSEKQEL